VSQCGRVNINSLPSAQNFPTRAEPAQPGSPHLLLSRAFLQFGRAGCRGALFWECVAAQDSNERNRHALFRVQSITVRDSHNTSLTFQCLKHIMHDALKLISGPTFSMAPSPSSAGGSPSSTAASSPPPTSKSPTASSPSPAAAPPHPPPPPPAPPPPQNTTTTTFFPYRPTIRWPRTEDRPARSR